MYLQTIEIKRVCFFLIICGPKNFVIQLCKKKRLLNFFEILYVSTSLPLSLWNKKFEKVKEMVSTGLCGNGQKENIIILHKILCHSKIVSLNFLYSNVCTVETELYTVCVFVLYSFIYLQHRWDDVRQCVCSVMCIVQCFTFSV